MLHFSKLISATGAFSIVYTLKKEGRFLKKCLLILFVLINFTLTGCSTDGISGEKPPKVNITVGNENFETKLGTYCWTSGCVDTIGPVELLEGKSPIQVNAGEKISFLMEYEPKPNAFHLIQIRESNESEVLIEKNSFFAPTQKGVYTYSYGVWWIDDKKENVSHGDAFYAFVLEVN